MTKLARPMGGGTVGIAAGLAMTGRVVAQVPVWGLAGIACVALGLAIFGQSASFGASGVRG